MFLCSQIQDLTLLCFASSDHQRQWLHSQRTNPQHLCSTQPCPTLTWASTRRAGHQRHRELPFPLPPPLRPRLKPEQLPPSSAETLLTSNKLPCTPDPALCPLLGSTSYTTQWTLQYCWKINIEVGPIWSKTLWLLIKTRSCILQYGLKILWYHFKAIPPGCNLYRCVYKTTYRVEIRCQDQNTHTQTQQKSITVTAGWCWVPSGSITACDPMISLLWRIIGQAVSICDTVSEKSRSLHSAHITFTAVNSLHISTETQERKPARSVKKHIRTVRYPRTSMFDSHSADIYSRMQIRSSR